MTRRQIAKYNSYTVLQQTCEKHAPVVKFDEHEKFSETYTQWTESVQRISDLSVRQAQPIFGVTESKKVSRAELTKAALDIAKPTRAFALATGAHDLAARASVSRTAILRSKDKDAADACQNVYDAAAAAPTALALAPYGVTAAKLKKLQTKIDAFTAVAPAPRQKITGRKTVTQRLAEEFRAADRLLTEGLDLLVDQFEEEFPDFVSDYQNARIAVNPPTAQTDDTARATSEVIVPAKAA